MFAEGALLATNGFIYSVVVFQVDLGLFPISTAGDVCSGSVVE